MGIFIKNEKDLAALVLRVGFGFFMAFGHGLGKLQMLLSGNVAFPALFGVSPTINLILAIFAEFLAAILVIVGLKTRLASVPIIFTMGVAAFVVHFSDPLFMASAAGGGSKEMALLFLLGFLGTFFLNSGKYSLDAMISKK
ncbi:DoxX family protein [Alkaliflexus imshenetskii]|uniref:DoxX family protein n=1 Tax=Alkaliflexus imshenetskii TaxID=286730 RepID=UPI00047902D5|nr:DoxX family protein [Alkaliflexus imshenetskii]